ncbi:hypothetical protein LKF67_2265 [Lactococcus lactis subsp. lactis]|nr:hypothetical protein [Lactococcus lactis]KST88511.1 hypothetical protein LKF67_2265 [Lactococcus lactis subsp. lactis]
MKKNYMKYLGMIVTAGVLMYGIMYLNTYELDGSVAKFSDKSILV